MPTLNAQLIWPLGAHLGEGPLWIGGALWFVDINGGMLHKLTPSSGVRESFDIGGVPSFVVPLAEGGLLVGRGRELVRVVEGRIDRVLATIDMADGDRTNDAVVDPHGRLWFGTMGAEGRAPTGRVYCFDGTLTEAGGVCAITNGPAVSPDGSVLYHVDTVDRTIWRFRIDAQTTELRDGRVFAQIGADDGYPDGVSVDAEGCVWVGLWEGWAVRRYSAEGQLLAAIQLPCANVTKVAFGGPEGRTGYVTTARAALTPEDQADQPLAGGLFAFEAPAPGLPSHPVRIRR